MTNRDLHGLAHTLLKRWRAIDQAGFLIGENVDVESIAESELGLTIVGTGGRAGFVLPPGKKAVVVVADKRIIIDRRLFNDHKREDLARETISHEASHYILHRAYLDQPDLPFSAGDAERLQLAYLAFSRNTDDRIEAEAAILAALLLVPVRELRRSIQPVVERYAFADWTRMTACVDKAEAAEARRYQEAALSEIQHRFIVPQATARLVLAYWHAHRRPPRDWVEEAKGARLASP